MLANGFVRHKIPDNVAALSEIVQDIFHVFLSEHVLAHFLVHACILKPLVSSPERNLNIENQRSNS